MTGIWERLYGRRIHPRFGDARHWELRTIDSESEPGKTTLYVVHFPSFQVRSRELNPKGSALDMVQRLKEAVEGLANEILEELPDFPRGFSLYEMVFGTIERLHHLHPLTKEQREAALDLLFERNLISKQARDLLGSRPS